MICIPIRKKTLAAVLSNMAKAEKIADLTEIWLDESENMNESDVEKIFKMKKKPVIYKFTGNKERLEKILDKKIEYIDIDIETHPKVIKKIREISPKTQIIISYHDFKKTPSNAELRKIAKKSHQKGADIIKIATFAKEFTDSLRMLSLLSGLNSEGYKAIIVCMGKQGGITRAAGHLLGNYLMYAPLKAQDKTAPGQIIAKELLKIQSLCH